MAHTLDLSVSSYSLVARPTLDAQVVCGYHTWAQITVGTALGAVWAFGWMSLGTVIKAHVDPGTAFVAVWLLYLSSSAVFIRRKMRSWFGKDAAL